jgi:AcrR family transcriptional regulator
LETRKEQKEKRRQEILCAALELFVSRGYAATKITDIAAQANMSTGLMFHYFESKEKLYEELIRMGVEATAYPAEQKCYNAIVCVHERTPCYGQNVCAYGTGPEK